MNTTITTMIQRAAMMLLVLILTTTTAWAETLNGVSYIDADGVTQTADNVTVLTDEMTVLSPGWYVVNSTLDYTSTVTLEGEGAYHLILADGGQMNIETHDDNARGIFGTDATLTIYGQTDGTGELNINASGWQGDAINVDDLTINGGQISATTSGEDASGLRVSNDVTINGGVITATATGDGESFGIRAERVIINGGQVTAQGSNKGILSTYNDEGGISLGWKNATDFIDVNSYYLYYNDNSSLTIAPGKAFTDGNGHYYTAANAAAVVSLTSTKLLPAEAYTVTFYSNGGSDVPLQAVPVGLTVTEPTPPTKEGKVFCGWYMDSGLLAPYDFTWAVTGNLNLYAKWADAISHDLSDATIQRIYRYTGSAVTPIVRDNVGQLLTAGTDYTVSYTGATEMREPGVYTLTVTGKGSYTGSQTASVRVLTFEQYDGTSLVTSTLPANNDNAVVVTSTITDMVSAYWYVVSEDVTVAERIRVDGDVNLVLCDGATLTAEQGISVTDGHSLTIYSQSGNTGALVATVPEKINNILVFHAAIGGDRDKISSPNKAGNITIHGGVINATAGEFAAGIGEANLGGAGTITIYGGKITASSINSISGTGIGGTGATVHLGWCRETDDFIEAQGFRGNVIFDKEFLLDGTNILATVENCAGQKMVPLAGTFYTVTFQTSGGSTVADQYILSGKTVAEPGKPLKAGYQFAGWYANEGCSGSPYDFTAAVTSSFTLYAKWEAVAPISYIDADGQTVTGFTNYILLEDFYTELPAGTYFVGKNVTVSSRIELDGTVNLILGDGKTLTAEEGIHVAEHNTLNIFQQSEGTGALTASSSDYIHAAIGASVTGGYNTGGTICIYGGVITANGDQNNIIGIGGAGTSIANGDIYIYGGTVTANGGIAIGSAAVNNCGTINILGGKITAIRVESGIGIGSPNGTIHLGWSRLDDDFIQSSNYWGTVIFDKSFVLASNEAIEANSGNIAGKKLLPNNTPFYDVSFETNGAGAIASQHIKGDGRPVVQPEDPVKQNCIFDGWYADESCSGSPYDFTAAVTSSFTLYAKWRVKYYVSFDKNGSDVTGTMDAQTLYVDEPQQLTACNFSRLGYTFIGWAKTAGGDVEYADGESVTNLATEAGASVTLFAQWQLIPYAISAPACFDVTVGGSAATTATIGQVVTLKTVVGYRLTSAPTVTDADDATIDVSDAGNGSYTFTMPASDVSITATYTDMFGMADGADGTADHAYVISSTDGWDYFCDLLAANDKGIFTGKTVTLGADIGTAQNPVTRMAGSENHDFTGTFDGNKKTLTVSYENTDNTTKTAPFSYVDGATIQNLVVDGSITGSKHRAAGFIGETGTTTSYITNCMSSLTISSDRYTGGFSIGGNVEIEGCVFNGTIKGASLSGGFVGYSQNTLKIKNSLFAPQSGSSISGGTFYYNGGGEITPENCYYTQTLGTAQGKQARSIAAGGNVTVGHAGVATEYDVSGITVYKATEASGDDDPFIAGLVYDDVLYAGVDDEVSLTLGSTIPEGYNFALYTASSGTLSGMANPYTLTMADEDVTIGANYILTVSYIDENGETQTCYEYTLLTGEEPVTENETAGDRIELPGGTYVVNSDVSYSYGVWFMDDVTLILADGANMTIQPTGKFYRGIDGSALTIYGQEGNTGTLTVNSSMENPNYEAVYANPTINGGNITVNGTLWARFNITINGGTLTVNGADAPGTNNCLRGRFSVIINGGTVTVTGDQYGIYADDGDVEISGGKVTATGQQYGINANGELHLYYSRASDFIQASSYRAGNNRLCFCPDFNKPVSYAFVDEADPTTEFTGVYNGNDNADAYDAVLAAMAGKKLVPKVCTLTLPDGVTASGAEVTVDGGTVKALAALPVTLTVETEPTRKGYTFAGLGVTDAHDNSVDVSEGVFRMPNSDATVSPTWTPIDYTIDYELNGGTVATPNPTTYNIESEITLVNPTREGLVFNGWTGTELDEPTVTVTIAPGSTEYRKYTATWKAAMADGSAYDRTSELEVDVATYTKTLGAARTGKFQAWLVPFDHAITQDDTDYFTFYKINMIANAPNPSTEVSDEMWVFLKKMSQGEVLHANMPYVFKPKENMENYTFATPEATLMPRNDDVLLTMMTAEDTYTVFATYENTTATDAAPFYYVGIDGSLSLGTTVTVGPLRWIIRKESKFGPTTSYARRMYFFDGDSTTNISPAEIAEMAEMAGAWYTLDGQKLDTKPTKKGVYIRNGKKQVVK